MIDYMRKRQITTDLRVKIKKYLKRAAEEDCSIISNEHIVGSVLSKSLKNELLSQIYAPLITKNPILSPIFDKFLLGKIPFFVEEKFYGTDDIIFLEDDETNSFYIVNSGKVEILLIKTNTRLGEKEKGEHFGEECFFTGAPRKFTAKTGDYCSVTIINREKFLTLLDDFPLDRIKDKIIFYKDYSDLKLTCNFCHEPDHTEMICHKIHLRNDKLATVRAHLEDLEKKFKNFRRRDFRYVRSGDKYQEMREAALKAAHSFSQSIVNLDSRGALLRIFHNVKRRTYIAHTMKDMKATAKLLEAKEKFLSLKKVKNVYQPERPDILASEPYFIKYDDLDRVYNFTHYFPHNNIKNLSGIEIRDTRHLSPNTYIWS